MANNEFAFNLLRKINDSQNVFLAPFSISQVFGMLFYGARGDTAKELRNALGYQKADLPNNLVHVSFNLYMKEVLQNRNSSNGYDLNTANAIFVNQNFPLCFKYRKEVQDLYEASIRELDFANDAGQSAEEINDWAKQKTNGKIDKILDHMSPSTLMVLLNAVYFKGIWKVPFDPRRTSENAFYNNGMTSQRKMVPMMSMTNRFFYTRFEDFQALELPYKGDRISMLILLPGQPDGLQALEHSITPEKLSDILEKLHISKLRVLLPKFEFQFEKDLTQNIIALGANRIFRPGEADLSGMTSNPGLLVSKVIHKTVVQVNEEGSTATAVTKVHVSRSSPREFVVNYPFLFVIVERGSKSNMILFLGRVNVL
ncbi:leukocyte elastase inhibitor [Nephila pilipes]|uniref:Leukocyte elastase inhibitor n=1 Tax=Nephila pilipes TaxID=299642 RepID=A0A8X6R000_NEPPI|nr:leukocyte elastase inhibitor [Nephila pilipes]